MTPPAFTGKERWCIASGNQSRELDQIKPQTRAEYEKVEKKRACERLLLTIAEISPRKARE